MKLVCFELHQYPKITIYIQKSLFFSCPNPLLNPLPNLLPLLRTQIQGWQKVNPAIQAADARLIRSLDERLEMPRGTAIFNIGRIVKSKVVAKDIGQTFG